MMDFQLSEEQTLFKDSIDRFVKDHYASVEQIRAARKEPLGYSTASWSQLAELGILAIPFAEELGGLGGSAVETAIVMEALGRGLVPEPFLASVVLAGGALRLAGSSEQQRTFIPKLIAGSWRAAFAHSEVQARYDLFDVSTTAASNGGGYVLNGHKVVVLNAQGADAFIVSARTAGTSRDETGISLFLVDSAIEGLRAEHYHTTDGGQAANLVLKDVAIPASARLGTEGKALPVIETVIDNCLVALAAEAVGIMDALTALTVDYLKQRKQFGMPIGSFQVLQHRAVDMLMAAEQGRSMAYYAMMMIDADDRLERMTALSAAKVQINKSARFVGQQAVQLHGAIGMTMEYLGAHYFRRLTMIETMLGNTPYHLRNIALRNRALSQTVS
jgi:pimeloyl-CoA dehydrogenase small subunit